MPPTEATLETTAVEQLDSNSNNSSNNSSNLPTDLSEMVTTDNKKSNDPDTATVLNPDDSTKNPTPTDKTDNLADPPKGTTEIAKDKEPAPVTQVTQHGVTQHGEQVVTFDHKAVKRPPTATLEAALSNLDPASIRAQAFKNNDFHTQKTIGHCTSGIARSSHQHINLTISIFRTLNKITQHTRHKPTTHILKCQRRSQMTC
jgi:hypothetical protein